MTQIEKIKAELERRIKYLDKYKDITEAAAYARQELIYFQAFIESMEQDQKDTTKEEKFITHIVESLGDIKAFIDAFKSDMNSN